MKLVFAIVLVTFSFSCVAKDCDFIPNKTLCEVSIHESPESFIKALGVPSIELKLENKKVALAYANKKSSKVFMLIFSNKLLLEARAWETNANIDFWSQATQSEEINLTVAGVSFIGQLRGEDSELNRKFKLRDADGFGQNIEYMGAGINLTFLPFYGPSTYQINDFSHYQKIPCNSITIENINGRL